MADTLFEKQLAEEPMSDTIDIILTDAQLSRLALGIPLTLDRGYRVKVNQNTANQMRLVMLVLIHIHSRCQVDGSEIDRVMRLIDANHPDVLAFIAIVVRRLAKQIVRRDEMMRAEEDRRTEADVTSELFRRIGLPHSGPPVTERDLPEEVDLDAPPTPSTLPQASESAA